MLSAPLNQAFNEQIKNEFFSAYLYLQMSLALEKMGYKVFAAYYRKKFEEEQGHAFGMIKYVTEAGGSVELLAIPEPKRDFASVEEILAMTLSHEQGVTQAINELAALAEGESDRATRSFLNRYIDEQVEEESSASDLLQMAQLAGPSMLFAMESRVAQMLG